MICAGKTARLAPSYRYCVSKTCGIDEAGRGPVIGDLVIAGILCAPSEMDRLSEIGVRDSKQLSRAKRAEIYKMLASEFRYHVVRISPNEIDESRKKITLNELEGLKFAEVINVLKPEKAYIDCADVKPENFRLHMLKALKHKCELVIEHNADKSYPVVSAASIIAKVERDMGIAELAKEYGDVGSGYPSDQKTIKFIEEWYKKNKSFPEFVRKSWKTSTAIAGAKELI